MTSSYAWSWEWPNRGILLRVPFEVAAFWHYHRQRKWQRERGGQLFASIAISGDLVIAEATPPHSADRASWNWLELDPSRCAAEVRLGNSVGRRLIGNWHTHPESIPNLSSIDVHSLTASARANAELLPACLAVVVGNAGTVDSIRAWRIDAVAAEEATRTS